MIECFASCAKWSIANRKTLFYNNNNNNYLQASTTNPGSYIESHTMAVQHCSSGTPIYLPTSGGEPVLNWAHIKPACMLSWRVISSEDGNVNILFHIFPIDFHLPCPNQTHDLAHVHWSAVWNHIQSTDETSSRGWLISPSYRPLDMLWCIFNHRLLIHTRAQSDY